MPVTGASLSTQNLDTLPDITALRRLCQSIAMLDAILCPEWDGRYYSFNSAWAPGEAMASMRDGSGDDYHVLFTAAGAILKGYAHESFMAAYCVRHGHPWPGVLDTVPAEFAAFLAEPAFSINETTFCLWRRWTDSAWSIGPIDFPRRPDPDGSAELLVMFDGNPATYKAWAEEYYYEPPDDSENDDSADVWVPLLLPLEAIVQVYAHAPLTEDLVHALNPALSLADLTEDMKEIGYPSRAGT